MAFQVCTIRSISLNRLLYFYYTLDCSVVGSLFLFWSELKILTFHLSKLCLVRSGFFARLRSRLGLRVVIIVDVVLQLFERSDSQAP